MSTRLTTLSLSLLFLAAGLVAAPAAAAAPAPLMVRAATPPPWPTALGQKGFFAVTCAGATDPCRTQGAVVSEAQRRLKARKYLPASFVVTGTFTVATGRAIQAFKADQAELGNWIGDTPRIGIRTYAALRATSTTTPPTPPPPPPADADCTSTRGRTCKADTPTAITFYGRSFRGYCPVSNATVGDGWGAGRGHQGVDLLITAAQHRANTPVYAVEAGTVIKSWRQDNGALVVQVAGVSGAGYFYGHQKLNLVARGAQVKAGQIIGYVGDTGSPGAPHLHFQFHSSVRSSAYSGQKWLGTPVDSMPLIRSLCF